MVHSNSPIEQGRPLRNATIRRVALRRNVTPAQVALAWALQQDGAVAIPKSSNPDHVQQNRGALDAQLTPEDLNELDQQFPPPARKVPLEVL